MTDHPFAAEAEIVRRATGLPGAIAADLSLFGGVLRCGKCHREQPLGDVGANLSHGWPKCCNLTMTWVTRKMLLAEEREVPDGYELVAVASPGWRLMAGKRCRAGAGYHRKACGRPSAAELNRSRTYSIWFAYCADHMYANWIENQQVMHWVIREI